MHFLSLLFSILVPPQITPFDFTDGPANSGDMILVSCVVNKGDFPINITWTLNSKAINTFEGVSVLNTNKRISQLSIDSVQAVNAGEYVCTARNNAGYVSHSAYLRVNGIVFLM